jgi:putative phage-type endonuclease
MSEIIQGSPEWFALRVGKVTASRVADVIATTKSGPSASRTNYLAELVAERLTGAPADRYSNAAMSWGTEKEPEARAAYTFAHEADVGEIGFVDHPKIAMTGASPDGLIGDLGLIEIKCPNTATHIETLIGQKVPGKYVTQMMWQMACTGRAWCDFASFDPRLPAEMRLFVKRVHRDDEMIAELEREVSAFLADLDAKVAQLQALYVRDQAA